MSQTKYILSLDQGTTSSRAILFDNEQNIVCVQQREFEQIYPHQGWVEHNPMEIWSSQYGVMNEVIAQSGVDPRDIAGIGITNQRETTILWDKNTGRPVYNAIVWQCRRTAELCEELKKQGLTERIQSTTGLLLDAYFSATKIRWILDHVPGVRERALRGEILFGTVETYLIWKLTGEHVTDFSNASRTMLFDIHKLQWDEELCALLGIPMSILPRPVSNSETYGYVKPGIPGFEKVAGVPVCGAAGDQQAALFGQGCFTPGEAKNTYGTGCFTLMNVGAEPVRSRAGLVTSVAWQVNGETNYALEGSVFNGGSTIQWLRDELGLISSSPECDRLAESVPDAGGVYVVPAFTGLGAPHGDQYARGTIVGLTRGCNKYHIIRATLDSICYQVNDVLRAMAADSGIAMKSLRVDGGASANNYLMQTMADISDLEVKRPRCVETTALGAAYLAGLAVGYWQSAEDITRNWSVDRVFRPAISEEERTKRIKGWNKAVRCAYHWARDEEE